MGRDRQGRHKNKRSKKKLGGERREVYGESERARRGLDLREPFLEAPPARELIKEPGSSGPRISRKREYSLDLLAIQI
ncbi:hypothetical protein TNCV_4444261 [Trichonephila clavipes]|nr:hypothetical protein TNCV_4444261 [Trichonephila clavipes]